MSQVRRPILRRAITRYSLRNRRRKALAISRFLEEHGVRTVLIVGAHTPTALMPNQGVVERAVAEGREIVMGINIVEPPGELDHPFQIADAREMPFADDYVDFALANAVIEHVGGEQDQRRFVDEHTRVARTWVITTPNKWFPIESHTATVFKHWSPRWRSGRVEFTRLLSLREFKQLLPAGARVTGHWWSPTFTGFYSR